MNRHDWRVKDDLFKRRQFLLSSFARMKIEISSNVYEFCDYVISQGVTFPKDDLYSVDEKIRKLYKEYAEHTNWDDRI